MKPKYLSLLAAGLLASLFIHSRPCFAQSLEEDLARLDAAIEMSKSFEEGHALLIKNIEDKIAKATSPKEAYALYDKLYQAQRSYKFDLAKAALDRKEALATTLGDRKKLNETAVDRAFLYCIAGMYLESQDLDKQIDSTLLSPSKLVDYYNYKQRFLFDFPEYSQGEVITSTQEQISYYRRKIIEGTAEGEFLHRLMRVREGIDLGDLPQADSLCSLYLSHLDAKSHEFAEMAYYKAIICNLFNRRDEVLHWYALSALADIKSHTKDNASMQCLAVELLNRQKFINRAFRYTQYSLNDAVFYNAKLRPWQIAMSLPAIENAYLESNKEHRRWTAIFQVTITAFAILLCFVVLRLISLYSKQKKSQQDIREVNRKLQGALQDLSVSNAAKEEYLGLFLSMCSTYIRRLKKFISYDEYEAELATFHKTFDNAFLQLYPDFVDKFNALLRPEARIELKKEETLNTELRIFALIKLGITQSSHIASLLRYSVNTIYNYRAQIKNAALEGKEAFEDRIKSI